MTEEEKNEVAIWKPKPFEGNDLLPYEDTSALVQVDGIPLVGEDEIDPDDMIVPAINLLHGTSQAVTDGVEGAEPGRFIHTGTMEVLPKGNLRLIVAHYHKGNALFPKEGERYAGLETCLSDDGVEGTVYGECETCRKCLDWDNVNNFPPLGAEVHHFVVMTSMGPAMLRMSRSSYKSGSNFLSTKKLKRRNFWAHPTVVRVVQEPKTLATGKVTNYYTLQMSWQTTEKVPDELQRTAYELYKSVAQKHEQGHLKSNAEEPIDPDFD